MPINAAKRSLRQLMPRGRVRYPYVGIPTNDLTPTLARHLALPVERGALVTSVSDDEPGRRAGLRAGEDSETFNGIEVRRAAT